MIDLCYKDHSVVGRVSPAHMYPCNKLTIPCLPVTPIPRLTETGRSQDLLAYSHEKKTKLSSKFIKRSCLKK